MMISAPILVVGGVIMALRQDVPLSGVLLVIIPLMIVVIGLVMSRAIPLFRRIQVKIDRINQVMRETLAGHPGHPGLRPDRHEEPRFDDASHDLSETALRINRLFALTIPTIMAIFNLSTVAILWFGRHPGRQRGDPDRQPDGVPPVPDR